MDSKQIKELIASVEKGGLKRIRIKTEKGFEIEIEKQIESTHLPARVESPAPFHPYPANFSTGGQSLHVTHHLGAHASHPSSPPKVMSEEENRKEGHFITSPMVGTLYMAPSPEDSHYVKVGDMVSEETVVCIIEAMKVMNEVKAGKKGKIAEILAANAEAVEFGTKLFRIV